MTPSELVAALADRGAEVPLRQARRLMAHVLSHDNDDLELQGLARRVREAVDREVDRAPLELVERAEDPYDRVVKYLLRSPDGALTEAVRIPLHRAGRYTLCLSSQVGCAMRCTFCATGRMGLTRNLSAWEMISAFRLVRRETEGRVTGVVFMGQGEPLQNVDEVLQAARVLTHPCGGRIGAEAISISTVGLVPQIHRLTREAPRYRLIVSLTSAVPERRRELLPVAGQIPLEELADALREHSRARRQRTTVAWVVLSGVNTGPDEVEALQQLMADVPLRFNLIDVNDPRPDGFRRADRAELKEFVDRLQVLGAPIVRRYSGGESRHAACGMLANLRVAGREAVACGPRAPRPTPPPRSRGEDSPARGRGPT